MIQNLLNVVDSIGGLWGTPFYEKVALASSEALGADYIIVGKVDKSNQSIRSVAFTADHQIAPNIHYELQGTPCHDVSCNQLTIIKERAQELFPDDLYLVEMGVHSYIGVPVLDQDDQVIGILVALFKSKLQSEDDIDLAKILFTLLRGRIAAEYVREHQELLIKDEITLREGLIKSLNHEIRTPVATLDHLAHKEHLVSQRSEWQLVRNMLRRTEVVMMVTKLLTGSAEWQPRHFRSSQWVSRLREAPLYFDVETLEIHLKSTPPSSIFISDIKVLENACLLIIEGLRLHMTQNHLTLDIDFIEENIVIDFLIYKSPTSLCDLDLSNWRNVIKEDFSDFVSPENLEFFIAQGIVDSHNGTLFIEDLGSQLKAQAKLPCFAVKDIQEDIDFSHQKVLIVDDVFMNRKILHKTLSPLGAITSTAADGQEAFALYKESPPDIILMDVQMPILNGLEATQAIRNYELEHQLRPCPIIAISANADRKDCLAAGMDEHLAKPVRSDELALAVYFKLEEFKA